MIFSNRQQAGQLLAEKLSDYKDRKNVLVLAVPRGGVVVGAVLASELEVPLDVVVTKKIGAPDNPELAIGAVAENGEPIFDQELVARLGINQRYMQSATAKVHNTIASYVRKFRGGRPLSINGQVVLITDDGVATGSTMEAAILWLRKQRPAEIILAVPTGAEDSMERLSRLANRTVCLDTPIWFSAVGQFYQEFGQVSDEEVVRILKAH